MDGYGCDSVPFYASGNASADEAVGSITRCGPMPSSRSKDCSRCVRPELPLSNPYARRTTNWRAVCGKSARTVRREGESQGSPYLYNSLVDRTLLMRASIKAKSQKPKAFWFLS